MSEEQAVTPVATFKKDYNFKSVKVTDSKYADTVALFTANGIKSAPSKVGDVDAVMREAITLDLPVLNIADMIEHDAAFAQLIMNDLVADTVKKLYVDKCLPLGAVTLADIVLAKTPKKRDTLDKSLFTAFAAYAVDILTRKGRSPGMIEMIKQLIQGRFTPMSIANHIKSIDTFPTILTGLGQYIADLEKQGNATPTADLTIEQIEASKVSAASFKLVYDVCLSNYENFLKSQNSKEENLDEVAM